MITHDYKLIFIHIPKCAGRSVCEVFNQRFDHHTAMYYFREYSWFWIEFGKFAIVRNPYARLVSMYYYIQQHRRHAHEPIAARGADGKAPAFHQWVTENFKAYKGPFNPLSPEAERGKDWELGSSYWFTAQVNFLSNDFGERFNGIKVFRLEDGMDKVKDYLEDKMNREVDIPVNNTSKHKPYHEHYDQQLIEFLSEYDFIKADLQEFGYNFNGTIK